MKVSLEIPDYTPTTGIKFKWEDGYSIGVVMEENLAVIRANREGLISLANHLLNLAQSNVPTNCHVHLDEHNALEDGSVELVIVKVASA